MSYDYNALLLKIHHYRNAKDWQGSVSIFGTLSMHCPMTPLLWIQYAHDAGQLLLNLSEEDALDVQVDTLEIGLSEFPGCALLQLHNVQLLLEQLHMKGPEAVDKVREAFERAITAIGRGSHRNEDVLVVQVYQHYATFVAQYLPDIDALSIFVDRAKVPMQYANDSILNEMASFASQHNLTITEAHVQAVEKNRRHVASLFQSLYTLEDDIDETMQNEQILPRFLMDLENIDWDAIISSTTSHCWMGLGGAATAQVFIKYAQACSNYPKHQLFREKQTSQPADLEYVRSLALPIYERAIAECPTVDAIWMAYLKALSLLVTEGSRTDLAGMLQSVAHRAFRNCPYSLEVAQFRIASSFTLAMVEYSVLDPDTMVLMVEEIIAANFLTDVMHHLQLYKTAIQTCKRRILFLLVQGDFDEPLESIAQSLRQINLTKAASEEIQDLIEDLRELYDTADKYLGKKQCTSGLALLWMGRCKTETYLLSPLTATLSGELNSGFLSTTENVRCFDKLLKIHPHPDSFRSYIQMMFTLPVSSPQGVAIKFRRIRHVFQYGLQSSAGKFDGDSLGELARQNLCSEYLQFEQLFGSEKSLDIAKRLVQKVLPPLRIEHWTASSRVNGAPAQPMAGKKRKQETTISCSRDSQSNKKKAFEVSTTADESSSSGSSSMDNDEMDTNPLAVVDTRTSCEKSMNDTAVIHKVKIGKMEFPAHPWTIRVSNLAPETEDMDLVDTFRPRCGAIVHAKIIRERHHQHHGKGTSKGWGLIQFENKESVDMALELNDIIGLHEKVLKVERSHMPAATLVPPGMHRVNAKGEGKFSKRNFKSKDKHVIGEHDASTNGKGCGTAEDAPTIMTIPETILNSKEAESPHAELAASTTGGVLAFQPRGVSRRKPKVQLMK